MRLIGFHVLLYLYQLVAVSTLLHNKQLYNGFLKSQADQLQHKLNYIEALEQRNEAQIGSFIDFNHQWISQSIHDRKILLEKRSIVSRLEEIRRLIGGVDDI